MGFSWLQGWLSKTTSRHNSRTVPDRRPRLRLEVLEDRCVLSAGINGLISVANVTIPVSQAADIDVRQYLTLPSGATYDNSFVGIQAPPANVNPALPPLIPAAHGTTTVFSDPVSRDQVHINYFYTGGGSQFPGDTFTYFVDFRNSNFSPVFDFAEATITVVPDASLPPVARDDTATTVKNQPVTINVIANDSHPNGLGFNLTSTGDPGHGTVTLNPGGTVTYTPATDFTGTDSFGYTITDITGGTGAATVTVTVNGAAPTPPVANHDFSTTSRDLFVPIRVLDNDSDPNGLELNVVSVGQPSHGRAEIAGRTVVYTPDGSSVGQDSFVYTITNTSGGTASATITVTVIEPAIRPIAITDVAVTPTGRAVLIDVLANDSDPSGSTPSVTTFSPAHDGTVILNGGGVTYTPRAGFVGTDLFTYTIAGPGGTATGTVLVAVGLSQNQDYVAAVYAKLLGREADPGGLAFWTRFLDANPESALPEIIQSIRQSDEYRKDEIFRMYRELLSREPDNGGLENSLKFLRNGGTFEELRKGILSSPEYQQKHPDYVGALYKDILKRVADPAGAKFFKEILAKGGNPRTIVDALNDSAEVIDLGIRLAYQSVLGRRPDADGLLYWTRLVRSGLITLDQVPGKLMQALEFGNNLLKKDE